MVLLIVHPTTAFCASENLYGPPDPATQAAATGDAQNSDSGGHLDAARASRTRHTAEKLEIVYQLLNALDAAQTISCVRKDFCHEVNPMLGRKPSAAAIIGFKASAAALHYGLGRVWLRQNPHEAMLFEIVTIAVQGVVCGLNFRYAF